MTIATTGDSHADSGQPSAFEHGTTNGYGNRRCRCPRCREAQRLKMRAVRAAYAQRAADGDPAVPHGTISGYVNWICRCELCRKARQQARCS